MRHWAARITRPSCRVGPNSAPKNSNGRKRSRKRRWPWIRPRRARTACSPRSIFIRKRFDLALAQVDRALEINPSDAENYAYRGSILVWAGKAAEALPWLEGALRLRSGQRLRSRTALHGVLPASPLYGGRRCWRPCPFPQPGAQVPRWSRIRCLRPPMPSWAGSRMQTGSVPISARLWPLLDARTFADQFGTQEARDHMLEGLKKAGFH